MLEVIVFLVFATMFLGPCGVATAGLTREIEEGEVEWQPMEQGGAHPKRTLDRGLAKAAARRG